MDIDLLSKMVKELILDKDEVALPGAGVFVAEVVPSTFSDKGYTINPPYRKLSFRQRENAEDTSLVDFYAESNKCSRADAEKVIRGFIGEMTDVLREKKTIIFPGLGRLRATRENNFFFVADEDLDIYPAGFGLSPISLKTHEETGEEVSAAVTGLADMLAEPVEQEQPIAVAEPIEPEQPAVEPAAEPETPVAVEMPAESAAAAVAETVEPEQPVAVAETVEQEQPVAAEPTEPERPATVAEPVEPEAGHIPEKQAVVRKGGALKAVMIVLAAFVVIVILYVIIARLFPGMMDSLLYNPEELEILRS